MHLVLLSKDLSMQWLDHMVGCTSNPSQRATEAEDVVHYLACLLVYWRVLGLITSTANSQLAEQTPVNCFPPVEYECSSYSFSSMYKAVKFYVIDSR